MAYLFKSRPKRKCVRKYKKINETDGKYEQINSIFASYFFTSKFLRCGRLTHELKLAKFDEENIIVIKSFIFEIFARTSFFLIMVITL